MILSQMHNQCYMTFIIPGRLLLLGAISVLFQSNLLLFSDSLTGVEKTSFTLGAVFCAFTPFAFLHPSGMVKSKSEELIVFIKGQLQKGNSKTIRKRIVALRPFGVRIAPVRAVGYVAINVYYGSMVSVLVTAITVMHAKSS